MNDDFWSMLHGTRTASPEFIAKVLGAWFDRQLAKADKPGRAYPFSGDPKLVRNSVFSKDGIHECATRASRKFVRELFARFVQLEFLDRELCRATCGDVYDLVVRALPRKGMHPILRAISFWEEALPR